MTVAQILHKFLDISESWIYSQIKGLEKLEVKSEIFCHKIINHDIFYHFPIYSYEDSLFLKKFWFNGKSKILHQEKVLLYWTEILKKRKMDLVHAQFGWTATKGLALARKFNLPFLVTFYGGDVLRIPFCQKKRCLEYKKNLPLIFDRSKIILCTSDFLKRKLYDLGAPRDKTKVWHLGVDLNLFKKLPKKSSEFKIICVGRFIEWKGQKYLIQALPYVFKKEKNIKVIFCGDGPYLKECQQIVKEIDLQDKIIFRKELSHQEVAQEMGTSDILIQPSISLSDGSCEALGMTLVEAGACQLPVIASNSGGIPEIVLDGKTGFLVEEKNIDQIAEKIITLIENEDLRVKMGNLARKYIEEKFDLEKQVGELKKIYQRVIKL